MENAQLALLFTCGYLLSRLLVKVDVPAFLVSRLLRRESSVSRILLYLIVLSAFLSILIPNAITAVTLLPIALLIKRKLIEQKLGEPAEIATALAMSIIFGSNIGGMASITATPANGVLVAYATIRQIPDHGILRFDRWLLWGVPLAAVLVLLAWGCLLLCLRRVRWFGNAHGVTELLVEKHPQIAIAARMALAFLVTSFVLSAAMHGTSKRGWVLGATVALSGAFVWLLFSRSSAKPLLTWDDCFRGLPWRGLGIVALVLVLTTVGVALGIVARLAELATTLLPTRLVSLADFSWVALQATFATQLMSNTVVQLALFETLSAHPGAGDRMIYLLLVVTLSSTCAFMTPIATGVNGLVYGEVSGASLSRMLFTGAVMNVGAAVVIGIWVSYAVAA
jgi:sodium-dependent dicarboxylate transporter 2/3/5